MGKRRAEHVALGHIVQRCTNPRHPDWPNYGGRGIVVADEWRGRGGFDRFLAHVGPKPTAGHSIDRIDNDRGYEPGNVRWATRSEQNQNTRSNVFVTFNGETHTLSVWAKRYGMPQNRLRERLLIGWTFERAVSEPVVPIAERVRRAEEGRRARRAHGPTVSP